MNATKTKTPKIPQENLDPITGERGAHPVGTGLGAAAGGVATGVLTGAAVGAVAGPVGAVAGAAVGAIAGAIGGGLAGKGMAEEVNPTIEHDYWRGAYTKRPYVKAGEVYEDYGPAYQAGWESHSRYAGKPFDDAESDLASNWPQARGKSKLEWERAKMAARDAWERARQHAAQKAKEQK